MEGKKRSSIKFSSTIIIQVYTYFLGQKPKYGV